MTMDRNYFDLTGQVALVTGCSSGIGIQMAKALASAGASIVAVARRVERVEAVAEEIAEEFGVRTLALHCDVRDTASVEGAVDAALETLLIIRRLIFYKCASLILSQNKTGETMPSCPKTHTLIDNEIECHEICHGRTEYQRYLCQSKLFYQNIA